MAARFPVTVRAVLEGAAPGMTVAVSSVDVPGGMDDGFALAVPNGERPDVRLPGRGAPTEKSLVLLSVSTLPLPLRSAAVVFVSVAVGPDPSKQFVPAP